ncbi:MAG: CBS domain-containing protein [Sulfolobus sp.]|nr:CBS domain-containing protein [Sulfolobus sp.]
MIDGNEIISIDPDAYVIDALDFMKRNNIRRIVVSRGNTIYGIFSVDEALYHIMNNDIECKLKDAKLKKPVISPSNNLKEILLTMTKYDVDSIIYKNKIITYKSLIKSFDWSNIDTPIGEISKEAIVVEPYTKIKLVGELMLKNKIRHIPVYENYLYGVVSSRDLVYNYNLDFNLSINKIMVIEVFKVDKEEPISSVAKNLIKRNIGSVIVTNSKKIEIATLKDLITFALRKLKY